jgi:hypothetical protein
MRRKSRTSTCTIATRTPLAFAGTVALCVLLALLPAGLPAAPASDGGCSQLLLGEHGVMQFVAVEGGCWQFQGDSGTHYEPIGGPAALYVDGAAGTLSGCLDTGLGSTCQVGALVIVSAFIADLPTDAWANLGHALAGSTLPSLVGAGALAGDDPLQLVLAGAVPAAASFLVVGMAALNAPFKGGVLVPDLSPPGLVVPFATGPLGGLVIDATWPSGVPSGFALYIQHWVVDAGGPVGFSASNAVSGTTP